MSKKFFIILSINLSFLLICGLGCAETGGLAAGGKISTLGVGGEVTTQLAPQLNARIGYNELDLDFDDEEVDDVEYDLGVDLSSFSALLDWHIFDNSFRISGGAISMNNNIDLEARPRTAEQIGNTIYTPAQIGTLNGDIDIDGLAPYIGIGWGNPIKNNNRWIWSFDIGAAFIDSPDVSLTTTGIVTQADLQREIKEIEDEADSFRIYPVISLGLFYRF